MRKQKLTSTPLAIIAIGTFALAWFVGQTAHAQETAKMREPGGAAMIAATASATVKAVDSDKRTVTLETPDGRAVTIKCGKNVVNFDQIKVGDQVKATWIERLAVLVGKAGSPNDAVGAMIARAPQGAKPGFFMCDTEEITDKIDSVDAVNHTVTLTGAEGKPQTIKVAPDVDLSGVKQGDDVVVRCTKGLALLVETPEGAAQPAAARIRPQAGEPGAAAIEAMTATATVESIDADKRLVTLKSPDGATRSIHLGPECVNFDQIQVGDQVRATLAEEIAVSVSKGGGQPNAGLGTVVAPAPQGAKPGIIIADSAEITGKIDSVDTTNRTITLAEVEGKPKTLKVGPKVDLTELNKGDDVTVRCTQALAIIVERP